MSYAIMAHAAPKKKREDPAMTISMLESRFEACDPVEEPLEENGQRGNEHSTVSQSTENSNGDTGDIIEGEGESPNRQQMFVYQFPIVKALFEKLSVRDLLNCAQVCKMWAEIARVVRKQRRNQPFIFLYHPYLPHTKQIVEFYNGALGAGLNVCAKSIDFVQNELLSPLEDKEENLFTSYPLVSEEIRPSILKCFNQCFFEPQMIVYFGSMAVSSCLSKRLTPKQTYTQYEHLFQGIEAFGPSVAVFGTGIVVTWLDSGVYYNAEMENQSYPMLTALAIPKIPGLHVKMFNVDENINSKFRGKVDGQNCKQIFNIQPDDCVKGIILFHSDRKRSSVLTDAVFQYLKLNPNCALGGGAMSDIMNSSSEGKSSRGSGLLICGTENVNVYSVGFFDQGITEENEADLLKVRNCNFEDEGSFAFMFACYGRGARMHKNNCHVESGLFKKYFPKTPLIGAFTLGEYIYPYIPGERVCPPRTKKSIEYAYTTVFVIVSVSRTASPLVAKVI